MEHTKEPWRHQRGKDGHEVWAPFDATSSMRVAACGWAESFDQANARRIVACVNACAGATTENLEKHGFLAIRTQQVIALEQQRDELQKENTRLQTEAHNRSISNKEAAALYALADVTEQRDELLAAAQAVIDRWETPLWKDVPATAEYIYALRDVVDKVQK